MKKRWLSKLQNPEAAEKISRSLGVSPLLGRILAARGFTSAESADEFLSSRLSFLPDPMSIPGMERACERITAAIFSAEPIWIYTDFDADGVTSAALLGNFFSSIGVKWRARLPRRDKEGYGLHADPLREIAADGGGLVITADCGICDVQSAHLAKSLGLGLVITDHHNPCEQLPDADAVVNPKIETSLYPDPMIAGVGVAWNLCVALRKFLREKGWFTELRPEPDLREFLDLVALGTVADLVPLRGVNRILVRAGLGAMNKNPRPGILALAETALLRSEYRASHLAYQLGPRINAAGRMESPHQALDLLMSDNMEEARLLAADLNRLNTERRAEETSSFQNAKDRVHQNGWLQSSLSLVVAGEDYHPGVVGIVASRLVEKFQRPSVVISASGEICKGSARSAGDLDIYDTLRECEGMLLAFGGHKGAAGVTLKKSDIPAFRESFERAVRKRVTEGDLAPTLVSDAEADIGELTLPLVAELTRLEPFGYGNPSPQITLRNLEVAEAGHMGEGGNHLRLRLASENRSIEAVLWNSAHEVEGIRPGSMVDAIGTPRTRTRGGRTYVQFHALDIKGSEDQN